MSAYSPSDQAEQDCLLECIKANECLELKTGYCRKYLPEIPHNRKQAKLFQAGDIGLVSSDSIIADYINFFAGQKSTDRESEYNHAYLMTSYKDTFECLHRVSRQNLFSAYAGKKILIGRYNNMTTELFKQGFDAIEKDEGNIYPYHRLILHAIGLAHIFHWNRLVCSEEVAKFLFKINARHYKFFGTTPDMLADEIRRELNDKRTGPKYSIIFEDYLPYNFYVYCPKCNMIYLFPEDDLKKCHFCGTITDYPSENETALRYNISISEKKSKKQKE